MNYYLFFIAAFLIIICLLQSKRRKTAAIVNHRKKHKAEELLKMKELAKKFIGKDCLIYTIAGNESVKGIITEVTDSGLLVDTDGSLQAVNLEYVARIREWPKNKNGKRKTVFE